jgi:hypothetical protein
MRVRSAGQCNTSEPVTAAIKLFQREESLSGFGVFVWFGYWIVAIFMLDYGKEFLPLQNEALKGQIKRVLATTDRSRIMKNKVTEQKTVKRDGKKCSWNVT